MSRSLDPQLHTHVVAANLTRGPDGRFTALHGAPLYRAAKTAGYLYQAHLRALVSERLGLEWGEVRNGAAELAGVPAEVLEQFSKRRQEMLRAAERGRDRPGIEGGRRRRRRSRPASASSTGSTRTPGARRSRPARASSGLGTRARSPSCSSGPRTPGAHGLAEHDGVDERALGDRLAGADGSDRAREHLR